MSTATAPNRLASEVRAICGADHVVENPLELRRKPIAGVPQQSS